MTLGRVVKTMRMADGALVPQLGLGPRVSRRRVPSVRNGVGYECAQRAMTAARWRGELLPLAEVLGVLVYPVVEYTGAATRLEQRSEPERCLMTLELWETLATSAERAAAPPAPLRIVGFVASNGSWRQALRQVEAVAGLGAGLIARPGRATRMQALEADATDMWVVDGTADCNAGRLVVRGRQGPVSTARRVPATRLMEEGLFEHAVESGLLRAS